MVEYPQRLTKVASTSSLLGTPRWKSSSRVPTRASTGKTSFMRKRLREETLAKLAQDSDADGSRPPCKRPSTDTSACLPDSMLDISSTSGVKSPTDIFTPRRRSARLRERSKAKEIQNPANESLQRMHEPDVFVCAMHQNSSTPPALLNHFKELARASPSLHSSSKNSINTIKNKSKPKHSSRSSTSNSRRRYKNGKSESHSSKSRTADRCARSDQAKMTTRLKNRSKKEDQLSHKHRRYSLFFLDAPLGNTRRRFSLISNRKSQFSVHNESEVMEEDEDTLVEDSEFNRTFVDAEGFLSNVIDESEISMAKETSMQKTEKVTSPKAVVSARYQVAMEFLQTEKNYVGILQTILSLFKTPLDDPKQPGGQILASEDVKAIFGSLPEMEVVHRSMRDDLEKILMSWDETSCVGELVSKYAVEFGRCYPPFVNFFEQSVETINRCDSKSPRFHAFLKINQAKKECGRQTLAELLINPVQRIPRIILLLQDIKKHTERENPNHQDVKGIEACLDALKEVMAHINEDKRKTESQRQIFDIVYEVDGCPPTLVSSHRQFVARAEVIAVDDNLCNRGDHICIFVFSDCVEIAKRRRGVKGSSFKSPNVHARPPANSKPMKHVKLMSLLHIKKVVDIKNSEDCEDAFSLYCRTPTDTQDWLYTFKIIYCSDDMQPPGEDNSFANKENSLSGSSNLKQQLLNLISRHRANALCKTNDDNFVCEVDPHALDISTTDLGSTLGRAVRAAKKSSRKLTRAFSFSRTPRRAVQRAMSNLLSPSMNKSQDNSKEESGSGQTSLTPSMSVTSLCTPQREKRLSRLPSTSSLQLIEEKMEDHPPSNLKPSVSTFTLARPQTAADFSDFPAIPTPPARRKKVGSSIKAATIALGRTGSFRKRKKVETIV